MLLPSSGVQRDTYGMSVTAARITHKIQVGMAMTTYVALKCMGVDENSPHKLPESKICHTTCTALCEPIGVLEGLGIKSHAELHSPWKCLLDGLLKAALHGRIAVFVWVKRQLWVVGQRGEPL